MEVILKKRYSVSRKKMGGRKQLYSKEYLEREVVTRLNKGLSLLAVSREVGVRHTSLRAALIREGLPIKGEPKLVTV